MSKKAAKLIFEKWKSEFPNFDKRRDAVRENFDKLFCDLYEASIDFDIAHEIIEEAIKKHLPREDTAQWVWKGIRKHVASTYSEWLESWREDIKSKAFQSFYDFFPLMESSNQGSKSGKKFGSMSVAEYTRQRKHADAFETLPCVKEGDNVDY